MKIGKYVVAMLFLLSSAVAYSKDLSSVVISNGRAYVTTPMGKKQAILASGATSQFDAKFIDLTFNGYADLLILRDRGANQEFYNVYLYSKEKDAYIYDKQLSDVPCLKVDNKKKELVGQCFHESACENWEEYYSVSPEGRISLVERKGTYCDPISGQGYSYSDRFRNRKKISSKVVPVGNQSGN
ncbi:XAC2610-related protein [Paraburkholderia hiiakae]|uniref:XAC2610-related protein n=1 Tax=Paraburkholderia hiiakae TaxID=1081782 RepID=UPI001918E501|nr:hypothetical protein [Paraburkholderia hiiakae]